MTPKRICFLYIAQAHQVLHSLTVALELARGWPDLVVEVATTSKANADCVRDLVEKLGGPALPVRLLGPWWLRWSATPPKAAMLAANLRLLSRYDVIVAPERTTALLRRLGLARQKLVYTQHGAGDRAGPFEPRLSQFNLVFAAGAKQRDRMLAEGLVAPDACAIVGYPKFDLVEALAPPEPPRLFAEERPIVLYNPHFDPQLSSWPAWGLEVLSAFADDDRYNLIFAPHIRLFEAARPAALAVLAPFRGRPHIHVDLGGPAAIDMTYTRMADVYLGDASSQVYEFIRRPRPCVFLNARHAAWRGDESYRHWRFGPVLDGTGGLIAAIDAARQDYAAYQAEQIESFRYSFDLQPRSSSQRAAQAIADLALMTDKRAA